jgi:hypothetical protein
LDTVRRSDSLYYGEISRRGLCDKVANLESDTESMGRLAKDMLATIQNAQKGFSVHPKKYRDYYSRAKKLGLVE